MRVMRKPLDKLTPSYLSCKSGKRRALGLMSTVLDLSCCHVNAAVSKSLKFVQWFKQIMPYLTLIVLPIMYVSVENLHFKC